MAQRQGPLGTGQVGGSWRRLEVAGEGWQAALPGEAAGAGAVQQQVRQGRGSAGMGSRQDGETGRLR